MRLFFAFSGIGNTLDFGELAAFGQKDMDV